MTTTIHRCGECLHQSVDHVGADGWMGGNPPRVGPCSQGGCACRITEPQVEAINPAIEIPTFPGFDHAADRWAKR